MEEYSIILVVILLASLVRVVAGFGDALLGMPILLLFFPLEQADTIVATYGLLIGLLLSRQYYSHAKAHASELKILLFFSAIGVFTGALALKTINPNTLILVLGCLLVLYPLVYFFSQRAFEITAWKKTSAIAGLLGGFLGGSVNTNGPPFVIYGQMRRWSPLLFIAMFQPLFLMGNVFNVISYATLGVYDYRQALMTLAAFPIVWVSYMIGHKVRDRIEAHFSRLVVALIFISGVMMLYSHL